MKSPEESGRSIDRRRTRLLKWVALHVTEMRSQSHDLNCGLVVGLRGVEEEEEGAFEREDVVVMRAMQGIASMRF